MTKHFNRYCLYVYNVSKRVVFLMMYSIKFCWSNLDLPNFFLRQKLYFLEIRSIWFYFQTGFVGPPFAWGAEGDLVH